jgi:hypothetical protein
MYDEQMPDHTRVFDAVYTRCNAAGRRMWSRVCQDVALANELAKVADVIYRVVLGDHELYEQFPFHDETSAIAAANAMYDGQHKAFNSQVDKRCWLQFVNEAEYRPFDHVFQIQLAKRCKTDGRRIAMFGDATANRKPEEWAARNPALDYCMNSADANGVPQAIIVVNGYGYMHTDGTVTDHPVSTPGEYEWFGNWMQDRYKYTSSKPYVVYAETQTSDSIYRGPDSLTKDARACNVLDNQYEWLLARLWYTTGRSWSHKQYQISDAIPQFEQMIMTF